MIFRYLLFLFSLFAFISTCFANTGFLPANQAFQFSAESISEDKAQLKWDIAPNYYLYHNKFKVSINNTPLKLNLPNGHEKDDPTFGKTFVHFNQVSTNLSVKPNSTYDISWQGCAEDGLCYPIQRTTIHTDADGLLPQNSGKSNSTLNIFQTKKASNLIDENTQSSETKNIIKDKKSEEKVDLAINQSQENSKLIQDNSKNSSTNFPENKVSETSKIDQSSSNPQSITSENQPTPDLSAKKTFQNEDKVSTTSLQWNDDSVFFNLLNKDNLFFNLFIFLGLGILLAFLPCSLPLIPILSGIIVQRATGYKAIAIALCFVLSMAVVYGIMGIIVAEIGYSFQRWFQSPIIVSIFALFFVLLALNMFGLYQIALPQSLLQKLDHLQNKQRGGTFAGAVAMGALSALIVGPCMSAPLAGALLFVSQTQNAFLGGLYLFILGFGIGLPLFIASVFGSKYLPKPGLWMDRLKISFGFIMLMVAVYFFRSMLPLLVYNLLLALILIILAAYLIYILTKSETKSHKLILAFTTIICLGFGIWNIKDTINVVKIENTENHLEWIQVSNLKQLENAISKAKQNNKPIVLDVYADWCVACQPIEREVLPRKDVQNALNDFTLIKLDLTQYDASQDIILKSKQILGPPTVLFLGHDASEKRDLRLTGAYSAQEFISQLNKADK